MVYEKETKKSMVYEIPYMSTFLWYMRLLGSLK
jgi:hypothetical protein